ncbi:MAG: hypothetical protein AB7P31_12310 [Steroidobacteraceae bacterium]
MLRRSPIARCLGYLAIALLLVRVGEAHLHLCLDGQDRAAAMHIEDAPRHDGTQASVDGHNDLDVDLSVLPWLKNAATDDTTLATLGLFPLDAILLALLLPALLLTFPPARLRLPVPDSLFDLRPPLRGPPR